MALGPGASRSTQVLGCLRAVSLDLLGATHRPLLLSAPTCPGLDCHQGPLMAPWEARAWVCRKMSRGVNCMAGCGSEVKMKSFPAAATAGTAG